MEPRVAIKKFSLAIKELNQVQKSYEDIWSIRYATFPVILINILTQHGEPAFALYLDLKNWNFTPPSATLLNYDLHTIPPLDKVPQILENGTKHIVAYQENGRIWFCSPGFYEYHEYYWIDRWELLRNTPQGKISAIVDRACNLIDRAKLI